MADFGSYAGGGQRGTYHYGLLRLEDGTRKPSYYALQTLCTLLSDGAGPAGGRTAAHLSIPADTADPRGTKATSWHANFLSRGRPVHAWWIPDSLESDP